MEIQGARGVTGLDFVVTLVGQVRVVGPDGSDSPDAAAVLENRLDAVMDELEHLGAGDPSINLDLGASQAEFAVLVNASNPVGAISQASGLLRTAIYSSGGTTPDWPDHDDNQWSVSLVSVRSDPVAEVDTSPMERQAALV